MSNPRRKRKKLWKSVLITVTLGTTLPVLALLCRGHSPSRYDIANLPIWERVTPTPPTPLGRTVDSPLPSTGVHFASVPVASTLLHADVNSMFANIENNHSVPPQDRIAAGKPGVWLEQAAVVGPWNAELLPMMRTVTNRLMTAQAPTGYLGAVEPVNRYTADDISAHANNLRGLLAYYRLTHQPASLYAAIRAGDFLIDNYDPAPGNEQAGAEDGLVFALARLYQACGDPKYLQFAQREEAARGCDGLGLCALYEATGDSTYLTLAKRAWKFSTKKPANTDKSIATPQFSAEIFTLTGDRRYLDGLRDYRATSVWPRAIAFTRDKSGLSINCLYPAVVRQGDVQLDIKSTLRTSEATVDSIMHTPSTTQETATADIETYGPISASQRPVKVEAEDILVTTKSHVSPTVHITLQPGCVAAVEDRSVEISLNGKPVRYDGAMGSKLALRPIGPASTKPATSTHNPLLHTDPVSVRTHGSPEA